MEKQSVYYSQSSEQVINIAPNFATIEHARSHSHLPRASEKDDQLRYLFFTQGLL